ncbi:efflux transporter outer membrane subunit [Brucella pituitosa]|uniref:efflux transporter outer membrane subunit n=1 Tax=Brucella pituitosa TaxID=571256 RepID=UPI0009A19402|nr:efflux transporter outer membrane subunit [Brucella pituitosa]
MLRQFLRPAWIIGSLPFIASCVTVGPDVHNPLVITPTGFSSKADGQVPLRGDWWKTLNDPVLNALIAQAITSSVRLADAKAKVRLARAQLAATGATLSPSLDSDMGYKRSDSAAALASSTTNLSFQTRWELDLFGGNRRGVEAAYYNALSADEQMQAVLLTLIGEVATNYAQLRGTEAMITIAQHNAAAQQCTVALTRTQLSAGQISQVDLLSAQTQAATTLAQIPSLRIRYASFLNSLTVLVGQSSLLVAQSLAKPAAIPTVPRTTAIGLPADLLFWRPDLRAARHDYASATAKIGQAEAALYPSVSLSGAINTGGANFGDLAKRSTIGWSFGPTLSVPIFQGGRLNAEVDSAKAGRDLAFIAYRKAILTALSEVENASVAFNQNHLRAAQLQTIVRNSRKIKDLTLAQFEGGSKSFIDVLNAQRDLLNAETSLAEIQTDLVVNYIALQKALGGSWQGRLDASKPEVIDGYSGPHLIKKPVSPEPPR